VDSLSYSFESHASGYYTDIRNDSLFLEISYKNSTIERKDGSSIETQVDYWNYKLDSQNRSITVPITDLNSIYYSSNARSTVNNISTSIAGFSTFSALVIAPLISINYRSGDFAGNRYYIAAGSSLGLAVISGTIALLSQNKSYWIITPNETPDKDAWYLQAD